MKSSAQNLKKGLDFQPFKIFVLGIWVSSIPIATTKL